MHDLPLLATATTAYRAVVREFGTVARLSWATLFIIGLIQYFLARGVLARMASALARQDVMAAAAIGRAPLWLALKMTVDAIGAAIVAVVLYELFLFDERKPGHYCHLAFGRREAMFTAIGFALVAYTLPFATIVISPFGEPTSGLMPFLATILFVVSTAVAVRLWPIMPMIIVEDRLDVAATWRLSRGRFWSLLALVILATLPIGVAALVTEAWLPPFESLMDAITGPRETIPPLSLAVTAVSKAQHWLVVRVLLDFLISIISTAIAVALMSYAYKALIGQPLEPPLEKNGGR
jgi:hypothetical protein